MREAENALRRAIEISPTDAQALQELGGLLEHEHADLDGAEAAYRAAVAADPSCVYSTTSLATFLAHHRDGFGAETLFRRAMKLDPTYPLAPSSLGGMLISTGKLSEAQVAIQVALKADDEFADPHWHLGEILIQRARKTKNKKQASKLFGKAEKSLRRALVLFPRHTEARDTLAQLLGSRGALVEAEALFNSARWNRGTVAC